MGLTEEEIILGVAFDEANGPMTSEEWKEAHCEGNSFPAPFHRADVESCKQIARDYLECRIGTNPPGRSSSFRIAKGPDGRQRRVFMPFERR